MRRRPALVTGALAGAVLALAACSGGTSGTSSSPATVPTASAPSSAAGTSAGPTTSTTSATTPAGSGGASATTGPALADAVTAAATGTYTVSSTVTGEPPMEGRGDLAAKTLAVHVGGDAPQDVEVVGGTAYTTLDGVTSGRQRVAVDLADPSDQLVDTVLPLVAATDLDRVVAAVRAATSVRAEGSTVTATVPGRSLASLLGAPVDGALPASGPVVLTLDAAGRPASVDVRLGAVTRHSTYGGWGSGPAITQPAATDIVESPL